jgi:hypothetical protein
MALVFDRETHRYLEPDSGIAIWPTDGDLGQTIVHFLDPAAANKIERHDSKGEALVDAHDVYVRPPIPDSEGMLTWAPFAGYRLSSDSLHLLYGRGGAGKVAHALDLIAEMLRRYNRNDALLIDHDGSRTHEASAHGLTCLVPNN